LTYANDLTVKAIVELSKTPDFDKFQFTIVGDGDLFDGTVEPVKQFKNVTLRKEFLTQAQIAELHKEHGVFLVPTRMDTQGVSRGEAMSSGLVGVTTAVAAIPEFVSDNDGVVVDAEDYAALSKALLQLTDSDVFVKLSRNGSERVKSQCSLKNTIKKELDLFVRNN
jgi:glycosyltransferase involved in cell wall biosynthesis